MCGIAGIFDIQGPPTHPSDFYPMIDALSHRGPDGRSVYKNPDGTVLLGHRRLTILDLSERAKQPMSDPSGRYWITFNGEIYNFLELRQELEKLGDTFSSDSDTEVILASYKRWGADCQLKFNGMWGFAIWDEREQVLFLSRDRFGVKPLLFTYDRNRLAFASELKAFLHLPRFEFDFDLHKVSISIQDTSILEPTTYTLTKDIHRLQAGHCLFVSKQKGLEVKRWWNTLDHLVMAPLSFDRQIEQFRELFTDACKIRMRSDVPLGNALSGGLDSSSVLSVMNGCVAKKQSGDRILENHLKAFVALYPQTGQDEFPFAKQMIDSTGVEAHFATIDASRFMDSFDDCLFQHEDIFELPSGPWMLYRQFRKEKTVISIDGHGADEILGGYHHQIEASLSYSYSGFKEQVALLHSLYAPGSQYPKFSFPMLFARSLIHRLRKYPRLQLALQGVYRKLKQIAKGQKSFQWNLIPFDTSVFDQIEECFPRRLKGLNQILFEDFHIRTLPMILRNFDRASMAHGVEIRAPFLDWRLVTFAFSLPTESKVGGGWTKRILREAMKGLLPDPIRLRRSKIGFTNPMMQWIQGPLKPFILDSVTSEPFLNSPIWNGKEISEYVLNSYKEGKGAAVRRAWEYIQANHLMQLFKKVGPLSHR